MLTFQVLCKSFIDPSSQISKRGNLPLNARLSNYVMVLDSVEQLRKAPKGVSFYRVKHCFWQLPWVHAAFNVTIRDISA